MVTSNNQWYPMQPMMYWEYPLPIMEKYLKYVSKFKLLIINDLLPSG